MNTKTEGAIAIIVAIFVLFTAMLSPWVSAGISIVTLVALGVYKLFAKDR